MRQRPFHRCQSQQVSLASKEEKGTKKKILTNPSLPVFASKTRQGPAFFLHALRNPRTPYTSFDSITMSAEGRGLVEKSPRAPSLSPAVCCILSYLPFNVSRGAP
jgi:hypothetical protein